MPDDANKPDLSLSELIKELQGVTDKQRKLVYKLRRELRFNDQTIDRIKKIAAYN